MAPEAIIAEKYNELVSRCNANHSIEDFNRTERVIWLLVSIRCEISINSFTDVFIQFLAPTDIAEAIGYMHELDQNEIADMFQQALDLFDAHHYDPSRDDYYALPETVRNRISELNEKAWEGQHLWAIDQQLCDMLDRE